MAMDIAAFRKLLALDPAEPLNRFGLSKKLFEQAESGETLVEVAEHLPFANQRAPDHLATCHVIDQVLIKLGGFEEARRVLEARGARTAGIGEGMRRDWGPAMVAVLHSL